MSERIALAGTMGWEQIKNRRGRVVMYKRGLLEIRINSWGEEGPRAWTATAPGISACGPSPEAAIYKLRERAARALDLTK